MTVHRPNREEHPDWSETDEALELLYRASLLGPEGEGMDLNGDYSLEEIVRIKQAIGTLRKAGELVNRELAQSWYRNFPTEVWTNDDWNDYSLGHATKRVWQEEGSSYMFASWLKNQPIETIEKVVSVTGLRVRPIPFGVRNAVFDEEPTSDDLRIVARKKGK